MLEPREPTWEEQTQAMNEPPHSDFIRSEDVHLHDSYLFEIQQHLVSQPLPAHLVSFQAYKAALHNSDAIQYPSVLPCEQCHKPTDHNISPLCDECDPGRAFRAPGNILITLLRPHWLMLEVAALRVCAWLLEPRYTQREWQDRVSRYEPDPLDEIPF